MLITIIVGVVALVVGILLGLFWSSRQKHVLQTRIEVMEASKAANDERWQSEIKSLNARLEENQKEYQRQGEVALKEFNSRLECQKAEAAKFLAEYKEEELARYNHLIEDSKQNYDTLIEEQERRHSSDTEALKNHFMTTTRTLQEQVENLNARLEENEKLYQRQSESALNDYHLRLENQKSEYAKSLADYKEEELARYNRMLEDGKRNYEAMIEEKERRHSSDTEALKNHFMTTTKTLQEQVESLNARLEENQKEYRSQSESALNDFHMRLENQKSEYEKSIADCKERHDVEVTEIKRNYKSLIEEQERRHSSIIEAMEKQFETSIRSLREQVENSTNAMLKQRQEEFTTTSIQNIDGIVKPLKETIDKMKEEMARNSTVQTNMSAEIRTNMEHMIRQSVEAQKSAEELTRAFKHESKIQGNWGEVVLSNLLEKQGFTAGKDFEVQVTLKNEDGDVLQSEDGKRMIPDVLLHLDENRDVIIDSKVSMTAYIDYANAEDESTRRQKLNEHIVSLKKHVDELSAKRYTRYLTNPHLDFVIMFVPQSPALWTATAEAPSLWQEAMHKQVFIADEQTLYAALRIIRITWTHIDQERNHKKLYELAQEMINRTGTFLQEFDSIGESLNQALKAFEGGRKKLLPGGKSISTTANQILSLGGLSNSKISKNKRVAVIPQGYISSDDIECIAPSEETLS